MSGLSPDIHSEPAEDGDSPHVRRTDGPIRRRRRRILSCDSCRRLKTRCLVEDGQDSCSRCQTLQLPCSKGKDHSGSPSSQSLSHNRRLESRLSRVEERMVQLSSLQQRSKSDFAPTSHTSSPATTSSQLFVTNTNDEIQEHHIGTVDQDVSSCPAEVIRKVGKVLNGGQRRTFDRSQDLLSIGLLDEETAAEFIENFVAQCRHSLSIQDERDLASGRDLRLTSPFLHTICCLNGIKTSHFDGTPLHRQVYEAARQMLGEAMLVTPLPIEELTAILIMAMYASSPTRGPEYIDSWLLSGHCAQQAMLSINFFDISKRVDSGLATSSDQRAIRTWANISLVNLHWAAITGRPPTIPTAYISQSQLLLNFEQATMKDGMFVAEINLFILLHEKFSSREFLDSDGSCASLCAWKAKWSYLFDLPTSGVLRMSHSIAWLLLARRSLEARRRTGDLGSLLNLAVQASPFPSEYSGSTSSRETESILYSWAFRVLHDFLALPHAYSHGIPEFYLLCLGYSLLVLGKYDETSDILPATEIYHHLKSLEKICQNSNSKRVSSATEFGLQKALARVAALLDMSLNDQQVVSEIVAN